MFLNTINDLKIKYVKTRNKLKQVGTHNIIESTVE